MSTTTPRYAYDPTGLNADNLVDGEVHSLSTNRIRAVAPTYGAYFTESVKIYDNVTDQLLTTSQYKCVDLLQEASLRVGKEICTLILITDQAVNGSVRLVYQTLGGAYQNDSSAIKSMYETIAADNRTVDWVNVLNKPLQYPPTLHQHLLEEVYGFEPVVDQLERLRQAIILSNVPAFETVIDWTNSRFSSTDGSLASLSQQIGDVISALNVEKNNRIDADNALQTLIGDGSAIDAEIQNRQSADAYLQDQITAISNELSAATGSQTLSSILSGFETRLTQDESLISVHGQAIASNASSISTLQTEMSGVLKTDGTNGMGADLNFATQGSSHGSKTLIKPLTNSAFGIHNVSANASSNGNHQTAMIMEGDQVAFYGSTTANFVDTTSSDAGRKTLMTIDTSTGTLTAAGDVAAYSDRRLKDNIVRITDALEMVKKLSGNYFIWNDVSPLTVAKRGKRDAGLIADEVKNVLPEAIRISHRDESNGETYDLVVYEKLIPVLVESIKTLAERIEALERKNAVY